MGLNATQKLIKAHLAEGTMTPETEIGLVIDQVLQQDATGTLVMLELEALNPEKTKAEIAVQYVDHNILQTDFRNADDHVFLQSAAKKFGYWYSGPGNGISHAVHMERFGVPGKTLLGSDSHTCAAGGLGMLAIGTGGLDVAMASCGELFYVKMPKILGVKLTGKLSPWVSAKDVVLEMLRRYDVKGCRGFAIEYYGDGLKNLTVWDRHVIANMGTEMGATATVFPSDEITKAFMKKQQRDVSWISLMADEDAQYDKTDEINLSSVEPLIACPSSPGKVVKVSEVAGKEVSQVVVGSSANPGLRDFWIVAQMLKGKNISAHVSLDINPSSRQVFQNMVHYGMVETMLQSGARLHQTGCLGCIGMGQAPASGKISLRTMPRNFPGRSGTLDDQVYLCSPETAAASAFTGVITDPRGFATREGIEFPVWEEPELLLPNPTILIHPDRAPGGNGKLEKGPNIKAIPDFQKMDDRFTAPVILKMEDNISTDEILKAGADVLPLRSNIEELSKYSYWVIDKEFYNRAVGATKENGGFVVIAGENYAQGSSREHAAMCPRYLGQKAVIAKSYSRIGWQNLINFGILPFEFVNKDDYDKINTGDKLSFSNLIAFVSKAEQMNEIEVLGKNIKIPVTLNVSERQRKVLLAGGVINFVRNRKPH